MAAEFDLTSLTGKGYNDQTAPLPIFIVQIRFTMSSQTSPKTYLTNSLSKLKSYFSELLDFQSRIWVVHIFEDSITDQSFVINEDGFKEPLEWMKKRDYQARMLDRVDKMKISQVIEIQFEDKMHRLMRVK
ncbi:conserved hypothetical protein [Vibrio coralliirubri]|nr:conserved hypothetical protein [Vibrio coralliirubri]